MQKILFIDPLIKATLMGDKTMTRRIAYNKPMEHEVHKGYDDAGHCILCDGWMQVAKSRFKVGETVAIAQRYYDLRNDSAFYEALQKADPTFPLECIKGEMGCHNKMYVKSEWMPHQIEITEIRCERIQDISDEDCLREGIFARYDVIDTQMRSVVRYQYPDTPHLFKTPNEAFAALIGEISKKGTWESNPFVFVYSYKLIK